MDNQRGAKKKEDGKLSQDVHDLPAVPDSLPIPERKMSLFQKGLSKRLIMILLMIGVGGISVLYSFEIIKFDFSNPPTFLFWMFSIFFALIGIAGGFLFGDKNIRVTFLRNASKKNFGFINFVSRGRYIFTKIKNIDDDFIFDKSGGMWGINRGKIYKVKGSKSESYEIRDEHIAMTGGIPEIFLDIDTFEPLTFFQTVSDEKLNPERIGAATKTAIAVEVAKGLLGNKTQTLIGMVILIIAGAAAYFGYDNYTFDHETVEPFIKEWSPFLSQFKAAVAQNQAGAGTAVIGGAEVPV